MPKLETELLELDLLSTSIVNAIKEGGLHMWDKACMRIYIQLQYNDKNKFEILNKMIGRKLDNDKRNRKSSASRADNQ